MFTMTPIVVTPFRRPDRSSKWWMVWWIFDSPKFNLGSPKYSQPQFTSWGRAFGIGVSRGYLEGISTPSWHLSRVSRGCQIDMSPLLNPRLWCGDNAHLAVEVHWRIWSADFGNPPGFPKPDELILRKLKSDIRSQILVFRVNFSAKLKVSDEISRISHRNR